MRPGFPVMAALSISGFLIACGPLPPTSKAPTGSAPAAEGGAKLTAATEALARASPDRAILVRGTYAFRGLPHFPPNAVPGLAGEYLLALPTNAAAGGEDLLRLRVWYTRENLVFGSGWAPGRLGGFTIHELAPDSSPTRFMALSADSYELFFEIPEDSPALRAFVLALEAKFAQFFASSSTDADLSFPAYVDIAH